jgi:hypothetical protein
MNRTWSTTIVIVAVSAAAVGAQSGKEMSKFTMSDNTSMRYTGCVETVNHGAAYLLTHVADGPQLAIGRDTMMNKDSGMAATGGSTTSSDERADHMMSNWLVLSGRTDLKKHVGRKVIVTGLVSKGSRDGAAYNQLDTLTVGSLKVVANACK